MATAPTIQIQPLPPAPSSTDLVDRAKTRLISQQWNQWILQLQQKVNVINSTLAIISQATLTPGGAIPISIGGTGATNKVDAFNNLSPLSINGDMLLYDGGNTRLPVGTAHQVLTISSVSGLPDWETPTGGGSGGSAITTGELATFSLSPSGTEVQPILVYFDDGNLMTF